MIGAILGIAVGIGGILGIGFLLAKCVQYYIG